MSWLKLKSLFSFIVKLCLVCGSVYFIYRKVISRPDFDVLFEHTRETLFGRENISVAFLLLFMMLGNWFTEAAKWKLLIRTIEPVGILKSFRSVLSGVTVSLFTPNRIGEFAGRVMHLRPGVRIKASIASVIGSMNQLLITIVMGGISLVLSHSHFISDNTFIQRVVVVILLCGIFAMIYFYFNMPGIHRITRKIPALRKITLYTRVFESFSFGVLIHITIYSLIRYIIFSLQFVVLLWLFAIDINLIHALKLIALIYLVLAAVPSIALTELTVRGSVALFFLSPLTGDHTGILAASSLLWLINMVIPALIGAVSVFYFRFSDK